MAYPEFLKRIVSSSVLIAMITLVGMVARFWKVEFIPFQNDADELAFVYAGQSLLETGVPVSWSSFAYDQEYYHSIQTVGDASYNTQGEVTFISPWFDHPYLLSLLQGGWTKLFGYSFPSAPPSLLMRVPMLFFALITLLLFWKVASHLFSPRTARIIYTAFALSPAFILGQRMVIGENLIVPLLLGALLILVKKETRYFWLLPICIAAALLTKMTGILVLLLVGLSFVLQKQWKELFIWAGGGVVLFLLLYIPFVAALGWNEFIAITAKQSFRLLGWSNPAFIMANPGFHHYIFYDLSYYLFLILGGFGAMKAVTSKNPQGLFLSLSVLGALLLLWSTSAEQDALGWYKLPLFTLLALASGFSVEKIKTKVVVLVAGIMFVNNLGLVRFVESPLPSTEVLRATVATLILIPIAAFVWFSKTLRVYTTQFFLGLVVLALSLQALYVADSFYDGRCQHLKCPIPTVTTTEYIKSLL